MRRQAGRTLAVLALVLGLAVMGLAQSKTLTILHTNDSHSAVLPMSHQPYPTPFTWLWPDHRMGWLDEFRGPGGFNREYAGIARMSTLIKNIRRARRTSWPSTPATSSSAASSSTSTWATRSSRSWRTSTTRWRWATMSSTWAWTLLAGVVSGALAGSRDPGDPAPSLRQFRLPNPTMPMTPASLATIIQKSIVKDDRRDQGRDLRPGQRGPHQLQSGRRSSASPATSIEVADGAGNGPQGRRLPGRHLPVPPGNDVR